MMEFREETICVARVGDAREVTSVGWAAAREPPAPIATNPTPLTSVLLRCDTLKYRAVPPLFPDNCNEQCSITGICTSDRDKGIVPKPFPQKFKQIKQL